MVEWFGLNQNDFHPNHKVKSIVYIKMIMDQIIDICFIFNRSIKRYRKVLENGFSHTRRQIKWLITMIL